MNSSISSRTRSSLLKRQELNNYSIEYVKKMGLYLIIQLLIILIVVFSLHKINPNRFYLFTGSDIADIIIFLILAFSLIYISSLQQVSTVVRFIAFYGLGILIAYLITIEYNRNVMVVKPQETIVKNFFIAMFLTVGITIIVILLLPYLLPYTNFLIGLSCILFIVLLCLIISGFCIHDKNNFVIWLSVGLIVFVGYLIADLTILVKRCNNSSNSKRDCDAIQGTTTIYIDLINILLNIFRLLNQN